MAEDIRESDSDLRLIEDRRREIVAECKRQEESCLYTSTSFYIWLRHVRRQKQFYVAAPIIVGGLAGLSVLQQWIPEWGIAILAFIASLFPALADALKIETSVDEITRLAAEFKALQDRFRRTANLIALGDVQVAEDALAELMDRMDIARSTSITPPEWAFQKAQEKIEAGHYDFAIDKHEKTEKKG